MKKTVVVMLAVSWARFATAQLPPPADGVVEQVCEILGGCATCDANLGTCDANLAACQSDLSSCQAASRTFPATGQMTKYVAGDDGDLKVGAPLSYTDNGNGTVTDGNTGLTWEAKGSCDRSGSATDLHDGDNQYPWKGSCSGFGGTCGTDGDCPGGSVCNASDAQGGGYTVFKWVAALNAANFAGHNDWRVPNVRELESLVDFGTLGPAVAGAFHNPPATCTSSGYHWSSSTVAINSLFAWGVDFNAGLALYGDKVGRFYVRAVRGGR